MEEEESKEDEGDEDYVVREGMAEGSRKRRADGEVSEGGVGVGEGGSGGLAGMVGDKAEGIDAAVNTFFALMSEHPLHGWPFMPDKGRARNL